MPRKLRFAPPGYYLHITQRGNYRQRTFHSDRDRILFLDLLALHADARQVDVLAYCIMSNHFHLVARSGAEGGISRFMQSLTGQYAQQLHGRLGRRGRLWQERFYSCVLDAGHQSAALRYVELNPVRAHIVCDASQYQWSSAPIHCRVEGTAIEAPDWLDLQEFERMMRDDPGLAGELPWQEVLSAGQPREERAAIRRATQWEVPLGDIGFIERLEAEFGRRLGPSSERRPNRAAAA